MNPVLEDDEISSGRKLHVHIRMIVSEDKAVDPVFPGKFLCKFIKRLILTLEHIFLVVRKAIRTRPAVSQTESDPRMKHAEKKLKDAVMEDAPEETITKRNRT